MRAQILWRNLKCSQWSNSPVILMSFLTNHARLRATVSLRENASSASTCFILYFYQLLNHLLQKKATGCEDCLWDHYPPSPYWGTSWGMRLIFLYFIFFLTVDIPRHPITTGAQRITLSPKLLKASKAKQEWQVAEDCSKQSALDPHLQEQPQKSVSSHIQMPPFIKLWLNGWMQLIK